MKKVLFLIHNLGPGGAEKVLVNLANHMDRTKFDVTVMSLFDVGVNRQFLAPHVRYRYCFRRMFRGNSHLMKLLSPRQLHSWLIRERYDVEIAYLEGPCARIISGCPHRDTRTLAWIHCLPTKYDITVGFRSHEEAEAAYGSFDRVVCVSGTVEEGMRQVFPSVTRTLVRYNTNDSRAILRAARETLDAPLAPGKIRLVGVGKLIEVKAFDRFIRLHARLVSEGYPVHSYILGDGPLSGELERLMEQLGVADSVTLLGYRTDLYKYVAGCDLFVCSSLSEGFSTAATEALIVGTPVCTVEVSGMKEMLGEDNEYGVITENSEEALYRGVKSLLDDPALLAHYRQMAVRRGRDFSTEETVLAVERLLTERME